MGNSQTVPKQPLDLRDVRVPTPLSASGGVFHGELLYVWKVPLYFEVGKRALVDQVSHFSSDQVAFRIGI